MVLICPSCRTSLSAALVGYDDVFVPLLACPKSVEMTLPMDQQGLLAISAGAFFLHYVMRASG